MCSNAASASFPGGDRRCFWRFIPRAFASLRLNVRRGVVVRDAPFAIALHQQRGEAPRHYSPILHQATFFTAGGFHVPSMIEGLRSFGQYKRIISWNLPDGAGSQFDSLSMPGESFRI